MVVFEDTSLYLLCLIQRYFWGHISLFVVSDSEMFLRTPLSIYSVWIIDVFWEHLSICSVWFIDVLKTPLTICSVWIREIVWGQLSLFVVSDSELFFRTPLSLFVVSNSGLFWRTPLSICCVWFWDVFESISLYL